MRAALIASLLFGCAHHSAPTTPVIQRSTTVLDVRTNVAGAQVFIDDVAVGSAPIEAHVLPYGTHTLRAEAPGHESNVRVIDATIPELEVMMSLKQARTHAPLTVVGADGAAMSTLALPSM